jgi:hypothetical protein
MVKEVCSYYRIQQIVARSVLVLCTWYSLVAVELKRNLIDAYFKHNDCLRELQGTENFVRL